MTTSQDLDRIASADVTVEEARSILQDVLKRKNAAQTKGVDRALRAWVWKTLTSRRSDPELEDWHGLFEQVRIRVADTDAECAARISILGELIYESIASGDISDPKLVLQRSHTREILELLVAASGGRLERSSLKESLGLQEANLTRVINMLVDAGLVSKLIEGKRVIVEITKAGEREIRALIPLDHAVLISAATETAHTEFMHRYYAAFAHNAESVFQNRLGILPPLSSWYGSGKSRALWPPIDCLKALPLAEGPLRSIDAVVVVHPHLPNDEAKRGAERLLFTVKPTSGATSRPPAHGSYVASAPADDVKKLIGNATYARD